MSRSHQQPTVTLTYAKSSLNLSEKINQVFFAMLLHVLAILCFKIQYYNNAKYIIVTCHIHICTM